MTTPAGSLLADDQPKARTVTVDRHKVELVPPTVAGRFDPPMHEWLALPVGENECPECGSTHWGTGNPIGYFLVRKCHDEKHIGCTANFRSEVHPEMIRRVIDALLGYDVRLHRGPA